jgi:hypothetical protein
MYNLPYTMWQNLLMKKEFKFSLKNIIYILLNDYLNFIFKSLWFSA